MTTAAVDNDNDGVADDVDAAERLQGPWVARRRLPRRHAGHRPARAARRGRRQNVALWGGLVILGRADQPRQRLRRRLRQVHGRGRHGPRLPGRGRDLRRLRAARQLGHLRYVSVRHAGDEIGANNELNGISLGGVGDGTIFEIIEVYTNFDDGIEWFGGTVNGKNLVVVYAGDDMFDLDQGYTGINQFLFGVHALLQRDGGGAFGAARGDKAGEFDGDNSTRPSNVNLAGSATSNVRPATGRRGRSRIGVQNMTAIGSTPDRGAGHRTTSPRPRRRPNRGFQIRNGFAGELCNRIIVNTGARAWARRRRRGRRPGFSTPDNGGRQRADISATSSPHCSTRRRRRRTRCGRDHRVANGNGLFADGAGRQRHQQRGLRRAERRGPRPSIRRGRRRASSTRP